MSDKESKRQRHALHLQFQSACGTSSAAACLLRPLLAKTCCFSGHPIPAASSFSQIHPHTLHLGCECYFVSREPFAPVTLIAWLGSRCCVQHSDWSWQSLVKRLGKKKSALLKNWSWTLCHPTQTKLSSCSILTTLAVTTTHERTKKHCCHPTRRDGATTRGAFSSLKAALGISDLPRGVSAYGLEEIRIEPLTLVLEYDQLWCSEIEDRFIGRRVICGLHTIPLENIKSLKWLW